MKTIKIFFALFFLVFLIGITNAENYTTEHDKTVETYGSVRSGMSGVVVNFTNSFNITAIKKSPNSSVGICVIRTTYAGSNLAYGTFSGQWCNFTTPFQVNTSYDYIFLVNGSVNYIYSVYLGSSPYLSLNYTWWKSGYDYNGAADPNFANIKGIAMNNRTSVPSPILEVNLINPINKSNVTSLPVYLGASVNINNTPLGELEIENVSLYINGTLNQTNSSGLEGSYNFSFTSGNGTYLWTIKAYDNNSVLYSAANGTFFINLSVPPIPTQIEDFPNFSVTFNYRNFLIPNASNNFLFYYFQNVNVSGAPTGSNRVMFSFINPDNDQQINITTNKTNVLGLGWDMKLTSKFTLVAIGSGGSNPVPLGIGIISYEENYSIKISPWGCNFVGCIKGNDFYTEINDTIIVTEVTEGPGFIVSGSNYLNRVFPDPEGLTLTQRVGLMFVFILIANLMVLFGFSAYFDTPSVMLISGLVTLLGLIYFTAMGYVPMGLVYFVAIILLFYFYIKNK